MFKDYALTESISSIDISGIDAENVISDIIIESANLITSASMITEANFIAHMSGQGEMLTEASIEGVLASIKAFFKKIIDFIKSIPAKVKAFFAKKTADVKGLDAKKDEAVKKAEQGLLPAPAGEPEVSTKAEEPVSVKNDKKQETKPVETIKIESHKWRFPITKGRVGMVELLLDEAIDGLLKTISRRVESAKFSEESLDDSTVSVCDQLLLKAVSFRGKFNTVDEAKKQMLHSLDGFWFEDGDRETKVETEYSLKDIKATSFEKIIAQVTDTYIADTTKTSAKYISEIAAIEKSIEKHLSDAKSKGLQGAAAVNNCNIVTKYISELSSVIGTIQSRTTQNAGIFVEEAKKLALLQGAKEA